jgi:hypothetical protein
MGPRGDRCLGRNSVTRRQEAGQGGRSGLMWQMVEVARPLDRRSGGFGKNQKDWDFGWGWGWECNLEAVALEREEATPWI